MTALIRDIDGILAAIKRRRDELNLSHETIDNLAGLQSGYFSKLVSPKPMKNLGEMSLPAVMGALAIGFMVVEDPEQKERVKSRWQPRKRPQKKLASAQMLKPQEMQQISQQLTRQEQLKLWGQMGGKASAKRRMKIMKKRTRQRIASHAARARWAKAGKRCVAG